MTRDSFFPLARVVGIKPSGDADRLRESGGGRWLDPGTQYDTRWSPLPLAVITRSSRHILVCGGILLDPGP